MLFLTSLLGVGLRLWINMVQSILIYRGSQKKGVPMFSPDTSLGYNAKVINNLEYQKHDWIF